METLTLEGRHTNPPVACYIRRNRHGLYDLIVTEGNVLPVWFGSFFTYVWAEEQARRLGSSICLSVPYEK